MLHAMPAGPSGGSSEEHQQMWTSAPNGHRVSEVSKDSYQERGWIALLLDTGRDSHSANVLRT